jgi:hypothetical protein
MFMNVLDVRVRISKALFNVYTNIGVLAKAYPYPTSTIQKINI